MRLNARGKRGVILALLPLLLLIAPARGGAAGEPAPQPPRLIVLVVVDQFRADFLLRFRDRFGPEGFNRLLREGANFTSCFFPYANTETAPGYATLATGTTPDRHGIAANTWYDEQRRRVVQAVEDEAAPLVGAAGEIAGASPRNLVGTTFADELRLATNGQAKVFGVALKDRAAIFSTGHTASGAYWYERRSGKIVTSRYYGSELPDWVTAFNEKKGAASYYGKDWVSGEKVFLRMRGEGDAPDARYYSEFPYTPYGNDLVLDFTRELVINEGLGADPVPDFLFVGLSANDYVGHRWGPYSEEVAEMTLRTDAQLAGLLKFLDAQVGAGNYWVVLSADHGVAPTLADARALGLPAKNIDLAAMLKTLEGALAARWGADEWLIPRAEITFNRETLKKHAVSLHEATRVVGEALMTVDGIRGYLTEEEARLDPLLAEAVRLNTYRGRSPDLQVVVEPFALFNGHQGGTTHGTAYAYDTHVPLIFFGAAFQAGEFRQRVTPADAAPTLAAALGLSPPALATGQVLAPALRAAPASAGSPAARKKKR